MISRGGVIAVLALIASACGGGGDSTATAADGDTVGVFYTGTLDDGSQFDSNVGGEPLVFVLGTGQVISGFEDAVRGMAVGETTTVRMEAADAYGEPNPELIIDLPSEGAPPDLAVGDQVALSDGSRVTILEIGGDTITVDANHPLAGQALTFEITVESIEKG